jgi:hypothetical protein
MEKNELYHEVFEYFESLSETPDDEESPERKDLMDRVIGYTGSLDKAQKYFAEVQANVETARKGRAALAERRAELHEEALEEDRKRTKILENQLNDFRNRAFVDAGMYKKICDKLGFKPTKTSDLLIYEAGNYANQVEDEK